MHLEILQHRVKSLPQISEKMATVSLVICIRLVDNSLKFYQKIHRNLNIFQKLQKAGISGTVCRPLDEQTSHFSTFWWHIYPYQVFLMYVKSY